MPEREVEEMLQDLANSGSIGRNVDQLTIEQVALTENQEGQSLPSVGRNPRKRRRGKKEVKVGRGQQKRES